MGRRGEDLGVKHCLLLRSYPVFWVVDLHVLITLLKLMNLPPKLIKSGQQVPIIRGCKNQGLCLIQLRKQKQRCIAFGVVLISGTKERCT